MFPRLRAVKIFRGNNVSSFAGALRVSVIFSVRMTAASARSLCLRTEVKGTIRDVNCVFADASDVEVGEKSNGDKSRRLLKSPCI